MALAVMTLILAATMMATRWRGWPAHMAALAICTIGMLGAVGATKAEAQPWRLDLTWTSYMNQPDITGSLWFSSVDSSGRASLSDWEILYEGTLYNSGNTHPTTQPILHLVPDWEANSSPLLNSRLSTRKSR